MPGARPPDDRLSRARFRPTAWAAALWAVAATRRARTLLRQGRMPPLALPRPPRLPDAAGAGAVAALRLLRANCLQRAAVMQVWEASHGRPRGIVVGVTAPSQGFAAHAWLEGEPAHRHDGFEELARFGPPSA